MNLSKRGIFAYDSVLGAAVEFVKAAVDGCQLINYDIVF